MAALLAFTAAVLLAANCPSPAQLDDVALSELSYKDLVASLRACAALAEQQQQLMASAALLLGVDGGGTAPPVPPRRGTSGSTSLPSHDAAAPEEPPRGQRAALPPEGTPAPPVPPRRRGRGARQPEATAAAASGDEAKPMRDRLATWHESREEQAIAQQAQQEVIARNLRPGKRQQRLAAQPALDEPRAWEVACEPTLYRLGMSPVQGCSPLTAEASEYPHYVDGGSHALPEEPSLLRRHGGDVGCGRVVRDGLLDRKEQLGLIASFERAMRSLFHQGAQTSFAPEAKSAVRQLGTEGHAYLMDVHRRVREQIAIDFRVPRLYSAGMLLTRIWADDLIPDDGMDVEPGHAYANPHVDKANRASYDYSALLYLNTQVH